MPESLLKVALLFGGRSAEHDVSILSARSIYQSAPRDRFEVVPVALTRDNRFVTPEWSLRVLEEGEDVDHGPRLDFAPWLRAERIDVVFPIIHGSFGEDGCIQGYLEVLGVPYVGSGVTASAVGMDKWMMKHAFAAAKLPIVDWIPVSEHDWLHDPERIQRSIRNGFRLPWFVKPANAGSSVGVTKVKAEEDLDRAMEAALRFDEKVLIERGIDAREIEVSVLGNEDPQASVPGEVMTGGEFYDYKDKYIDDRSSLVIPAKVSPQKAEEIRRLAVAAFRAIGGSGYSRVDFFMERGTDRLYLNEINTIPGFTRISMYPKLWEATELKYPRVIERLIDLGLERGEARRRRFESTMRFFDEVEKLK